MHALLSVHGKKHTQLQKGVVEILALVLRRVIMSHPFFKWDEVYVLL